MLKVDDLVKYNGKEYKFAGVRLNPQTLQKECMLKDEDKIIFVDYNTVFTEDSSNETK